MKLTAAFGLLFLATITKGQSDEMKLSETIRQFHQALVSKNTVSINQQTDKALTYGHSNGWIETKPDLISDLESGMMTYNSFREDSLSLMINGNVASARFIADINATLKGNTMSLHLKVLEVWVKKGKRWVLFARQAVR
jgi:hypothetical protein